MESIIQVLSFGRSSCRGYLDSKLYTMNKLCVIIFVGSACVAFVTGIDISQIKTSQNEAVARFAGKTITEQFIARWEKEIRNRGDDISAQATLIPPIAEPVILDPVNFLDIFLPIPGLLNLTGNLGFGECTVTGLSQLSDDFNIVGAGQVTLDWNVALPSVALEGTYDMDLLLDLGSKHTVKGSGELAASVETVFFKLHAEGLVPLILEPIRLNKLEVNLGFKNATLSAGDGFVDGTTQIDWQQMGNNIEFYFNSLWNEEVQGLVNEIVRCSIDHVVNNCTLPQLTNPDSDCLKLVINPECFNSIVEPPVTDRNTEEPSTFPDCSKFTCTGTIPTTQPTDEPSTGGPNTGTGALMVPNLHWGISLLMCYCYINFV